MPTFVDLLGRPGQVYSDSPDGQPMGTQWPLPQEPMWPPPPSGFPLPPQASQSGLRLPSFGPPSPSTMAGLFGAAAPTAPMPELTWWEVLRRLTLPPPEPPTVTPRPFF